METYKNEKTALSRHEMIILKAIYALGGREVPTQSISPYLEKRFGYQYARTTIVTFISRMAKKGYVMSYRKGRESFQSATMTFEDFIAECANDFCDLWFDGNVKKMHECVKKVVEEK